jgi:hypothetical protein
VHPSGPRHVAGLYVADKPQSSALSWPSHTPLPVHVSPGFALQLASATRNTTIGNEWIFNGFPFLKW